MIEELSKKIYDLFVVNNRAIAIQAKNGLYYTKYFEFNEELIAQMIRSSSSLGTYQQYYKSDKIKWICFDFDCKSKISPDVSFLFDNFVSKFIAILKNNDLNFATEFSGRRGIHVWIVFNEPIRKSSGYKTARSLYNDFFEVVSSDEFHEKYSIDLFPATGSAKGNKVGKQVKIPLSRHKSGGKSYFFEENYQIINTETESFLFDQLEIIRRIKVNNVDDILRFEADNNEVTSQFIRYKFDETH
ncbi:MAG: hypothetical protein VB122_03220, partial [Erysipelotrichales bacterium]|nr:hypothetical protein [Erysipelotrichales bacterium]